VIVVRFVFFVLIPFLSFSQEQDVHFYGHRGCRGLMPENSIQSFQRAIELGVDGIELDVVVNKERQLVISHEPYFKASFCLDSTGKEIKNEKRWNIYEMTQEQINLFDCGSKIHSNFTEQAKFRSSKPLLQELFSNVDLSNTTILFEVKSSPGEYGKSQPYPSEFVKIITDEIAGFYYKYNIIFMSFDSKILEEIHAKLPEYRCVYLTYLPYVKAEKFVNQLSFKPYALGMFHRTIHRKDSKYLHLNGIKLFAWTVNKKRSQNRLMRLEIDGIITDYPDRIK
jgi:glycerophosphoryl diester phosphodiesterase